MSLLEALIVILLVMWLLGMFAFKVTSGLLHVLLVAALIVFILRLVQGRRVL